MRTIKLNRLLGLLLAFVLCSCAIPAVGAPSALETEARYEKLYEGDSGDAVTCMQRALTMLCFLRDGCDGIYGPETQAALHAFVDAYMPGEPAEASPDVLALLYEMAARIDVTQTVYIAPYSGIRYHASSECWGLNIARDVESVTLGEALDQDKSPCKICYDTLGERHF